jgi:hypothetical protein
VVLKRNTLRPNTPLKPDRFAPKIAGIFIVSLALAAAELHR